MGEQSADAAIAPGGPPRTGATEASGTDGRIGMSTGANGTNRRNQLLSALIGPWPATWPPTLVIP